MNRARASWIALALMGAAPALAAGPGPGADGVPTSTESSSASVSHAAVQPVIDAVEAKYAAVQTIRARFTQVKKDAFGEVRADGDVVVARPARMRWRFTTGDRQVFATDGETLTIWSPVDGFFQQLPDATSGDASVQGFLTSLDRIDEVFHVTLVDGDLQAEQGPTLELVPIRAGAIQRLRLDLSADLVVEGVTMTDAYDNVTDLSFRDMVFDAPVSDDLFKFDKPSATQP